MSNVVATNLFSLNAQRNLANNSMGMNTAMERLSSGLRVNGAKDDAAGLAVAERMNAQARGMGVAIRNASDAISMVQTAEGALQQVTDTLQRMRELAVQSANGTYDDDDRALIETEFASLQEELTRIADVTQFNGQKILDGTTTTVTFQVGANTAANIDTIDVEFTNVKTTVSGMGNISTAAGANSAIASIDDALDEIAEARSTFGAAQNRFEATIINLRNAQENQMAAKSRIMDADFAAETAALTKAQVLQQSGIAILAQANQAPQAVLGLLR
ncbi:Flagellin protein FlaB [Nitrincola lacisaponensis]|uniref:Flagellin n=1 Tax=Nitrincola lacisaponensis TaxID=267850 RepID=A0A063Y5R0_9GAMM|nr:flagellin [Nitrincola lacisaponensis]KDE40450.1 Flagellin protein FlaB [Nitrincola lacisaponensis]